jgi:LAGLIDADG DNA endonuclease family
MILTKKHDINGAIIGMVMGDSGIYNPDMNPYLSTEHGSKQVPYLLYKKELLKSFLSGSLYPARRGGLIWQTEHTTKLKYLLDDFYKFPYVGASEKIKKISKKLLNRTTPLGLALWYCDDGTLCKRDRIIRLATFNFGRAGNEEIQSWLEEKYGIKSSILLDKKCKPEHQYFLSLSVQDTKRFLDVVGSIVQQIPSMEYKAIIRPYKFGPYHKE